MGTHCLSLSFFVIFRFRTCLLCRQECRGRRFLDFGHRFVIFYHRSNCITIHNSQSFIGICSASGCRFFVGHTRGLPLYSQDNDRRFFFPAAAFAPLFSPGRVCWCCSGQGVRKHKAGEERAYAGSAQPPGDPPGRHFVSQCGGSGAKPGAAAAEL